MALLRVSNLTISFPQGSEAFQAVDDVSFKVRHGETVCLVGESGSGKSLTALALMGLLPEAASLRGRVALENELLVDDRAVNHGHVECGRSMAMIFQEPMASLNPSLRVLECVGEAYRLRQGVSKARMRKKVAKTLEQTGIVNAAEIMDSYPWQLSGGLAQRVMIASALILKPRLLIADEPTTALDVTTQAQILRLLVSLRTEKGLALVFITHDLSVAALMGGRTLVMRDGKVVEEGETLKVLEDPQHPYSKALIACTPARALAEGRRQLTPTGTPPRGDSQ